MNIINGKVYHGNITIVNGRVIEGISCDNIPRKMFDETKSESASGVKRIIIVSDVDVKVSTSNQNEVTAHLHGEANTDVDLKPYLTRLGDEIRISVESEEDSNIHRTISMISVGSVMINESSFSSYSDNLTLDVQIPTKVFEELSVEGKNANIDVYSSVNANNIALFNKNGNSHVLATFQVLSIHSKNGNVKVNSEAHCDVGLNITNKNGNVDVTIGNIATSEIVAESKNGNCHNNPRLKGRYTLFGNVKSKNGNVRIR